MTITYNDESLNENGSLEKAEFQRFLKRLRSRLGDRSFKYFGSGEYGEKEGRPHYHLIGFGVGYSDYGLVSEVWGKGFVHMGYVSQYSARYVADYMKKETFKGGKGFFEKRELPFQLCSKGIGLEWVVENKEYLKDNLNVTVSGIKVGLPRYYALKAGIPTEVLVERGKNHNKAVVERLSDSVGDNPDTMFREVISRRKQTNKNRVAHMIVRKKGVKL